MEVTMSRLPVPGNDDGIWGDVLNSYLQVALQDDGSLKPIDQSKITGLPAALAGKADSLALSSVATTGSYTDLTNKPTIPATAADVGAVASTTITQITRLSQAEYDALGAYDPLTLYVIIG
jgi:hypothetical protein